jgi:hypothetical protein
LMTSAPRRARISPAYRPARFCAILMTVMPASGGRAADMPHCIAAAGWVPAPVRGPADRASIRRQCLHPLR